MVRSGNRLILLLLLVSLFAAGGTIAQSPQGQNVLEKSQDSEAREKWAYSLGIQAYIFGLPLVVFEREYALRTDLEKIARIRHRCPCDPVNVMGHKTNLATDKDVMPYAPNNDTVYSAAMIDYRDEPVILSLPDIDDRYWSLQVADPYTENLFYVGSRATGGRGGHHAFIAPDWQGELPNGVVPHRTDHHAALVVVRIGIVPQNDADLKAVNELQTQAILTSLSNFRDASKHGQSHIPDGVMPRPSYDGELAFFQLLADLLIEHEPAAKHDALLNSFKTIGLEVGKPFNPESLDAATRRGLIRALEDGEAIMKWKVKYRGTPYASRWNNLHEGTYGFDYLDRAAGALQGLVVHDREESVYFSSYESGDGEFLDGSKRYTIHFDKDELPPVAELGFWSLTMYGRDFQLVKNDIDRFSIGDRTPGIRYNDDGSLDFYIQGTPPEGRESNWLPSPPDGIFRITYRIYLPEEAARNPLTLEKYTPTIQLRSGLTLSDSK